MLMIIKIRSLVLKLLAGILTSVITFLFAILKVLTLLPFPSGSYLYRDLAYNITCCSLKVNLQHNLFLVVNSTLSLLSALIIANYCENMLAIVEWTSHQTHAVFLNIVIPKLPEISTYTPSWIVEVYLMLGYLGITTSSPSHSTSSTSTTCLQFTCTKSSHSPIPNSSNQYNSAYK